MDAAGAPVSGYPPEQTSPRTRRVQVLLPERAIRVLIVCDQLGSEQVKLTGVGRLMVEWATGFDPGRVRVTACTLRTGGVAGEAFVGDGVPLIFLGHHRLSPLSITMLVRLIRARQIDVLHLQDFGATGHRCPQPGSAAPHSPAR